MRIGQTMPPSRQAASPPRIERRTPRMAALSRPVLARVESLPAGSWARMHSHPWAQLSYAVEGILLVRTATGSYMAPPERAVWIPPGVAHEVSTTARAEMRSLYVQTPPDQPVRGPQTCVLGITPLVRELIVAVCALPGDYDEAGAAGRLVGVLLDQLATLPPVALDLPWPTDPRLLRVSQALQAEPADQRTLAQWGFEVGLSERSLARLFREQTGLSVGDWRRRLRLLLALGPLAAGAKVSSVAHDSGYSAVSAFIAAFSQEFGQTPTQMFDR
jgi:AraC-like DNA-binding protein/mannose-6-phosphate isomerase-like protein (cupin superfamily)